MFLLNPVLYVSQFSMAKSLFDGEINFFFHGEVPFFFAQKGAVQRSADQCLRPRDAGPGLALSSQAAAWSS